MFTYKLWTNFVSVVPCARRRRASAFCAGVNFGPRLLLRDELVLPPFARGRSGNPSGNEANTYMTTRGHPNGEKFLSLLGGWERRDLDPFLEALQGPIVGCGAGGKRKCAAIPGRRISTITAVHISVRTKEILMTEMPSPPARVRGGCCR
jgi:hypothetical protein